jgi:hypothetical protein
MKFVDLARSQSVSVAYRVTFIAQVEDYNDIMESIQQYAEIIKEEIEDTSNG